jgi:prolipoprotein diacylglyceryltransferase
VSSFAFLVGLGASLGLWRVIQRVPRWQAPRWMNIGLFVLLGSLVGSRFGYVAFHTSYFAEHFLEAFQIWKGGLDWVGALAGGVLALVCVALFWHIPLALLADHLILLAPPLAIAVWLGCWQSGCAYGAITSPGAWWGIPARDESGAIALRIPIQPLAALSLVLYFWWLEMKNFPRETPGRLACLALSGLSINLLAFTYLRADPAPLWYGVRPDIWFSLTFTVISLLACAVTFRERRTEAR